MTDVAKHEEGLTRWRPRGPRLIKFGVRASHPLQYRLRMLSTKLPFLFRECLKRGGTTYLAFVYSPNPKQTQKTTKKQNSQFNNEERSCAYGGMHVSPLWVLVQEDMVNAVVSHQHVADHQILWHVIKHVLANWRLRITL